MAGSMLLWESLDFGHGRIEERKYVIIKNLDFLLDRESWMSLQAIVRVDSRRTIKKMGEVQQETRYYLTSLINKIALNTIRNHDDSKRFKVKIGIKSKRKFAALIDEYLFELLHSL